jgi:phosphoglycerate dehydrogenase-like enzyme
VVVKVLVTTPRPERYLPGLDSGFPGVEFVVARTPEEEVGLVADAEVVFGHLSRAAYLAARRLRWIQCHGAGVEWLAHIPELATSEVVVTNTRGAHAATIAEHTFGLLVALARGFPSLFAAQRRRVWLRPLERPAVGLAGLTLGIIGFGHIGRAIAARAHAFAMPVVAVDAQVVERPDYVAACWTLAGLPELLRTADAVIVAAPLTPETRGLIGAKQFAQMKPTAYLVAISRGGVVDEAALAAALRAGALAGAALDVQVHEPVPPDSPLWDVPDLMLTPHCSGESRQTTATELSIFRENLARYAAGASLTNVVDKRRGY